MCLLHQIADAFTQQPEQHRHNIASDLIKRSFDDIDPTRLLDYHTHVAGHREQIAGSACLSFPLTI